jgi:transcriptional regulator with XRE-family HTH domain
MSGVGVPRAVHNRLLGVLARLDVPLGELARRTMLPPRILARLRSARANPPLRVAERIAEALDVRVETVFHLTAPRRALGTAGVSHRTGLGPLLAERRLNDVQLARAAGLDRAHVNRLKNGRAQPSVATALAVAAALGVDVAIVFPPRIRGGRGPEQGRRRPRSAAVRRTGVRGAAVGPALVTQHDRPPEVDGEC